MQLHYKSFGSGDPIIILHGLFGMLDNWRTFARHYEPDHSMYLLDHRNHGRSGHSDVMDYPSMATDLKETMDSLWMYDGALILGHSMGGKTAMQLAFHYPDLVKALIVIDIAPKAYQGGHETIIQSLQSVPINQVESREEVKEILADSISDPGIIAFLMKNLSRQEHGGYQWKCNLDGISTNYLNLMAAPDADEIYEAPTLFVRGLNSSYIQSSDTKTIKELFPQAKIADVPDAGHWVHVDQPLVLQKLVSDFLSSL